MQALVPALIILESPVLPKRPRTQRHNRRGRNAPPQTGHYLEQAEGLAAAWPGEVIFMLPPGGRSGIPGVAHEVELILPSPTWRNFLFRRSVEYARWRLYECGLYAALAIGASALVSLFQRLSLESRVNMAIPAALTAVLRTHQSAIVLVSTADEILCESIVRASAFIRDQVGRPVRIIFCWHHGVRTQGAVPAQTFAEQLRRWKERANSIELIHVAQNEASAKAWSLKGHAIDWFPLPLIDARRAHVPTRRIPRVYLYSKRGEHGATRLGGIMRAILNEFKGEVLMTLWTTPSVGAALTASASFAALKDHVHIAYEDPAGLAPFHASLHGHDVGVLPYSPRPYMARSSGALLHLLAVGVPVVVPSGTGLSDLVVAEGVGEAYTDPSQISAMVSRIISSPDRYQEAIDRYLRKHHAAFTIALQHLAAQPTAEL